MVAFINHYAVLGLPSGEEAFKLSNTDITKAYRLKALELHPDKRPNDPKAVVGFQTLQSSYEILKNENSRKAFNASLMIRIKEQQQQKVENSRPKVFNNEDNEKIARWRRTCGYEVTRRWGTTFDHETRDRVRRLSVKRSRTLFVRKGSVRWL